MPEKRKVVIGKKSENELVFVDNDTKRPTSANRLHEFTSNLTGGLSTFSHLG